MKIRQQNSLLCSAIRSPQTFFNEIGTKTHTSVICKHSFFITGTCHHFINQTRESKSIKNFSFLMSCLQLNILHKRHNKGTSTEASKKFVIGKLLQNYGQICRTLCCGIFSKCSLLIGSASRPLSAS